MSFVHTESYRIRAHEIDTQKKVTVPAIIQIMQEASMQHIIKLGASVWDMESDHKSWVLLNKEVQIFKRPSLNKIIHIRTYPSGFNKFFAYRDFKCFDESGTLIAQASSCWVLVDVETKQISRILPRLFDIKNPDEEILPRPKFKLKEFDSQIPRWTHRVSMFDLDWNHHLNNSHLNKIILSAKPSNAVIDVFQVSYKSEAFENDVLEIFTESIDKGTLFQVWNKNTEKIVAMAKAVYK